MATPPESCPEPLRRAFLDLLAWTLVSIRNEPSDPALSLAHSDHMHNIPDLLADFRPRLLAYSWECERPIFLKRLEALGREPTAAFAVFWEVVGEEYERLIPKKSDRGGGGAIDGGAACRLGTDEALVTGCR